MRTLYSVMLTTLCAVIVFGQLFGCSGSQSVTNGTATVNVSISDPASCQAPGGIYSHVYITVSDVVASANQDAPTNDSSFVDLTPSLSAKPQQVDLLGQSDNHCFLAMLGSTQELQAANYQQIRIILVPDSATGSIANNACGSFANCVILADGSVHDLELSSEAKTGIKIPSGQIASGQFSISKGQTKDLDIDFNTCDSIVQEGNGNYRLKPVLHAGEVQTTSASINGEVVAAQNAPALAGAQIIVALEQKDAAGIDRVLMTTTLDANGGFVFCPVPAGSYDIVVSGVSASGTAYASAVLTGIQPGQTAGHIPLSSSGGANAVLTGTITTAGTGATSADLIVSSLQSTGANGPVVTIPTINPQGQAGSSANITTDPGSACPANTDCGTYSLYVPAAFPMVGAYSVSGATFAPGGTGNVGYTVDALAFVPGSGGAPDCSPSESKTAQNSQNVPLVVITGAGSTAATLVFTGCQ